MRDETTLRPGLHLEASNFTRNGTDGSHPSCGRVSGAEYCKTLPAAGPFGFFDPLGLTTELSDGKVRYFREVEIKHGRGALTIRRTRPCSPELLLPHARVRPAPHRGAVL